jgi:hypothetical protein
MFIEKCGESISVAVQFLVASWDAARVFYTSLVSDNVAQQPREFSRWAEITVVEHAAVLMIMRAERSEEPQLAALQLVSYVVVVCGSAIHRLATRFFRLRVSFCLRVAYQTSILLLLLSRGASRSANVPTNSPRHFS